MCSTWLKHACILGQWCLAAFENLNHHLSRCEVWHETRLSFTTNSCAFIFFFVENCFLFFYDAIVLIHFHCIRSVYIVYTVLGDVSIYVVGKDQYDELACMYSWNLYFIFVGCNINSWKLVIPAIGSLGWEIWKMWIELLDFFLSWVLTQIYLTDYTTRTEHLYLGCY